MTTDAANPTNPRVVGRDEAASPFSAVRFVDGALFVRLGDRWAEALQIGPIAAAALVEFARSSYKHRWLHRLAGSLPRVFVDLGSQLKSPLCVTIRHHEAIEQQTVECTEENHRDAVSFNRLTAPELHPPEPNEAQTLKTLLEAHHSMELKPFEFQDWIINAIYGTHSTKASSRHGRRWLRGSSRAILRTQIILV